MVLFNFFIAYPKQCSLIVKNYDRIDGESLHDTKQFKGGGYKTMNLS